MLTFYTCNFLLVLSVTFTCPRIHGHLPTAPIPSSDSSLLPPFPAPCHLSRLPPPVSPLTCPSPVASQISALLPASPVTLTCFSSRPSPSTRQDDFFILQEDAADSFLESIFKTEFVSLLCKRFEEAVRRPLALTFSDTYDPPPPAPSSGWAWHRTPSPASQTDRNAPLPCPLPSQPRSARRG